MDINVLTHTPGAPKLMSTLTLMWTGEKREASCKVPPCSSAVQRPMRPMEGRVNCAMTMPDTWVFKACQVCK